MTIDAHTRSCARRTSLRWRTCSRIPEDHARSRASKRLCGKAHSHVHARQPRHGHRHTSFNGEFTSSSDEDVLPPRRRGDKKMYFICLPPPDNPNMYCEEMADGMDWVCVVEDDAFTHDLLDDFSA